jgi:aryl-alcohol dehydrogenase-like predicted oxidoreductase
MEEARIIAQQISVRLTNGFATGDEATRRNLELLRHCENVAAEFGVTLTAAMDEWVPKRSWITSTSVKVSAGADPR